MGARILREDRQDDDWAEEDRLGEEQVGEDREQEEEPCGEEERVDRRREQGARPEDQGVHRGEEGHPAVQEGEGVHGLSAACLFPWRTGRLLWVAGASCSLSERWACTPPLGPNR